MTICVGALGDGGDRTYAWRYVVQSFGQSLHHHESAYFVMSRAKAIRSAVAAALLGLLRAPLLAAAPLTTGAQGEIDALLARLAASGCQFQRNGSWHAADAARAHLRRKLDHLVDKGLVANAEQFIERAASRSSTSGSPYRVRCGDRPPMASAAWLHAELRVLRATRSVRGE